MASALAAPVVWGRRKRMDWDLRRCFRPRRAWVWWELAEATAESAGEPMARVEWRPEDLEFPDRGLMLSRSLSSKFYHFDSLHC